MKRDDLITAIKVKMDIDPADNDDYYKNFYNTIINECLSVIANSVLPYQRVIEVLYGGEYDGSQALNNKYYYKVKSDIIENGAVKYKKNGWLKYDKEWKYVPYNKYGFLVDIPYELLSFSDQSLIEFIDDQGDFILDADVIYINSHTLALPKDGNYKIWYNSLYPEVGDNNDEDLDFIPPNVAQLIPTYVASKLLMAEDTVRATVLANDFELMLSRLDDNKIMASYNINNKSGWTR